MSLSENPALAGLWHPTKNLPLTAEIVAEGSNKKVWWQCSLGHEWEAQPNSLRRNSVCPYCTGRRVLSGFNDFATTHPELAAQWHPTKNTMLTPDQVSYGSKQLVWWLGDCGHSWEATVGSRAVSGQGCAVCRGLQVEVGVNDLAFTHPELAKQWHPTKNEGLTAEQITAASAKKVWWLGECGHEWFMSVSHRTNNHQNCAVCAGKQIQVGVNDLVATHPEIAGQWHPTKNNSLTPEQVTAGSGKEVWWVCDNGHEFLSSVSSKVQYGCALCAGQRVELGVNDLASQFPVLAGEWSEFNPVSASEVYCKAKVKVAWVCEKGHEWVASVVSRVRDNSNCPVCANKKLLPGFNDFAFTHPELAGQWHLTKNGELLPSGFSYGFNGQKFWWLCEKGHEWETTILARSNGNGCPRCAATSFVSKPEEELADYVSGLGFKVETSIRNIIKGELDIYVPEKQVAVEFNGLYWHNEAAGKDKNYHTGKRLAAAEQGIQLIQVWEDDWNKNPELVKRMVAHKLGVSGEKRIYARKTSVIRVTSSEAELFLERNHLQGYRAAKYFGLVEKITSNETGEQNLVSVVGVQRKGEEGLEIIRFASSAQVPGGFSKLLNYVLQQPEYVNVKKVYSYSHNDYSDGGVYKANGFELAHPGKPGYAYWKNGWKKRQHRLAYSPSGIKKNPNLKYVEGASERELAELNGLVRVWDSGSSLWVKEVR